MNAADTVDSMLTEELEVLESIYMDDISINKENKNVRIEITLHPSTADDENKKFVCLTLRFHITNKYPDEIPEMTVKNPRGLSEAHLLSIADNLKALAKSRLGESMLFELIEYAKDSLTDNNCPSCDCSICLEKFQENGEFFRTECYHYFHKYCIHAYTKAVSELFCPVCRLPFTVSQSEFSDYSEPPAQDVVPFSPNEQYKQWLKETAALYAKQKRKGGIINLEQEKNKYLIKTNERTFVDRKEEEETEDIEYNSSIQPSENEKTEITREEKEKSKKYDYIEQVSHHHSSKHRRGWQDNRFPHHRNKNSRKTQGSSSPHHSRRSEPETHDSRSPHRCDAKEPQEKFYNRKTSSTKYDNSKHHDPIPQKYYERSTDKQIDKDKTFSNESRDFRKTNRNYNKHRNTSQNRDESKFKGLSDVITDVSDITRRTKNLGMNQKDECKGTDSLNSNDLRNVKSKKYVAPPPGFT